MQAIDIHNLSKTYADGTQALKNINLSVNEGDFFALLGANGAGKTTIIGILTGLVKKTNGQAKIFELDTVEKSVECRRIIGVVPQELNFNQFEKVEDIIINQGGFFGIKRSIAQKRCEALLKELELWDKRQQISRNLSGGMKRRLMIARALINQPRLLILDEPTAGVDVELRHSMWNFLGKLNKQGTTILLTTHYLEEVEKMCRHAAIIKDGEIITHDSVKNLRKLVDSSTYIIHVEEIKDLSLLQKYDPVRVDDQTIELEIDRDQTFSQMLKDISSTNMSVIDFTPKENRMEKLFLKVLKGDQT